MWEFLSLNPVVAVIAIVALLAFSVLFTFRILKRGTVRKIGPIEFTQEEANIYADRFMRVMNMVSEHEKEIYNIENREIIREQMRVTEITLANLQRAAKQLHLDLLNKNASEKNSDPQDVVTEINVYALRISIAVSDLKDEFRRSYKENHFVEKTPKEFSLYVRDQLAIMFSIVENAVDLNYNSKILNIEDLREANRNRAHEYMKMLEGVYLEAREISARLKEKIKEKQKCIRQVTASYLTGKPIDGCFDEE